jgi:RNA polymerase sigma-70 factor, ECF subfamily
LETIHSHDDCVSIAAAAWPDLPIDADGFRAYLAQRPTDVPHVADLYLAFACANGDARAIAAFDKLLAQTGAFIARIDSSAAFADEVRQLLREKLLVARPTGPAKITDYTGRGPLGAWLRVAAVRTALNLRRSQGTAVRPPAPIAMRSAPDPELDHLRTRYAGELKAAFQTTLEALDTDERNVLRLHYLDGMSIDEIGRLYRIHRATAARWIERARDKILVETRRLFNERHRLTPTELDSVIDMLQSKFDVSIERFLRA